MCSVRINRFTPNFHLNIRCLYPPTISFQENIYKEHIQLAALLQVDEPPSNLSSHNGLGKVSHCQLTFL